MTTDNKAKTEKPRKYRKKVQNPDKKKILTVDQIKKEMRNKLRQIKLHKEEIKKHADSIVDALAEVGEYRKTIADREQNAGKRKKGEKKETVDLDYHLANMYMIKKLLGLSGELLHNEDEFHSKKLQKRALFLKKRIKKLGLEIEGQNGRQKILVVEDDATTANIISYVLTQHEFRVSCSQDAEDGLKRTLKEKPDLIILDIMLPGMDGFQLLSILKENEETARIPVILISSLTGEHDILKGLEIGAEDYILKPFSPRILHLKVKKLTGNKNEHVASHHLL